MPSRDGRRQLTPTSSSLTQLPKLNREALMGKTVELGVGGRRRLSTFMSPSYKKLAIRFGDKMKHPSKKGTIEGFEAVTTKSTRESSMSSNVTLTGKV